MQIVSHRSRGKVAIGAARIRCESLWRCFEHYFLQKTEAKIQLSNRLGAFRNKKSSDSLMPLKKKKEEENKSDRQRGKE